MTVADPSGMGRVLVVEDDADIRTTLQMILADEGYSVATANNGREALDHLLRGARPDLILLDLMMPIMNGDEFLTRLRQGGDTQTPVVVVSAATDQSSLTGANQALKKPFDLDNLFDVVRQYCHPATLAPGPGSA